MANTRSIIRHLVLTADDLDPAHRANLLTCLETTQLPVFQVSGPLYVNQTKAAEIVGVGRTKFPEVAEYRRIQPHEMAPGFFMYFTPDLIVHLPKDVQSGPQGVTVFPPKTMPSTLSPNVAGECVA